MLNLFDRLFYNTKTKPIISVNKYPNFNFLPKDNITFKFPKFNPSLIHNNIILISKKDDLNEEDGKEDYKKLKEIMNKKNDKNPDNYVPLTIILLLTIIGCFILKKKY